MDEENLGKLLQAFSNCNYIEFVKVFSMIHGFDATFEFLRNALTTIPFMAFKRKFGWWGSNNDDNNNSNSNNSIDNKESDRNDDGDEGSSSTPHSPPSSPHHRNQPNPHKRQAIRSTWEDNDNQLWTNPETNYDSDYIPSNSTTTTTTSTSSTSSSSNVGYTSSYNSSSYRVKGRITKKRTKRKLRFMDLPFELIINIFGFLKPTDLLITSLVSKEWNRFSFISTNELLIDNRNGKNLDLINRKIYKHSEYLKKIKCSRSIFFNSSSLHTIVNHCRQVVDLQFYHCPHIHDTHVESICQSLPQLKRIVLHSEQLTSRAIESLTKTRLVEVELGGFTNIAIESFAKLGYIATLTSLDVSGVLCDTDFVFSLSTCKRLRTLRVGIVSEQTIQRLPFLENLQYLSIAEWDFDDSTQQQDQQPSNAATNNSNSKELNTRNDGRYLVFLERCKKLRKFELTTTQSTNNVNSSSMEIDQPQQQQSQQQANNIFKIRDISNLIHCSEYLTEIELDVTFDLEYNNNSGQFFNDVFSRLVNLETIFISGFNLDTKCWKSFTLMPRLHNLSLCCTKMSQELINNGLRYIGSCHRLTKLSLINSTSNWIEIGSNNFSCLLGCKDLGQLRLGGSRGGGWVLSEGIFATVGKMKSLQHLDTSNSRGVTEQCFEYLSQSTNLESLECGIKIEEDIIRNAMAEWCGTGTLINCKGLKRVVIDVKLPQFISSEITSVSNSENNSITKQPNPLNFANNSSFNFVAKLN